MSAKIDGYAPLSYRTLIPARIDRLQWSPFHTRMVVALGAAWSLDGLEITIAAAAAGVLTQPSTLALSTTEVGLMATRPSQPVHFHPRRLPLWQCAHGVDLEQ
jgi:hypothetical protein